MKRPETGADLTTWSRLALAGAVAWLFAASSPSARSHEGPEHEIEELTVLIEGRGVTADLLIERAIEYAVLGKYPQATRDLEHAIRLDPHSLHALRELGRIQFVSGQTEDAVATVTRALNLEIGEPIDRAGLLMLRAECRRSQDRLRPALDDSDAALRLHEFNPEWYLFRSDLQRRLKQNRSRLAGIEVGLARTGAGILEVERVEALLDAGQFRAALRFIEPQLESSRIKCRWLIRRGRARLGLGEKPGGTEDLRTALLQIETLLDPGHPDPTLLLDQAAAQVLLGEREAARRCLALARDKGGDPAITERIRALIEPNPGRTRRDSHGSTYKELLDRMGGMNRIGAMGLAADRDLTREVNAGTLVSPPRSSR